MMLITALQAIVATSVSNKEKSEGRPRDENEELLSRDDRAFSYEFCEDNEQCKVRYRHSVSSTS